MEKIKVLISGAGTMGKAFAKAVFGSDIYVLGFALAGEDYKDDRMFVEIGGGLEGPQPKIVKPSGFESILNETGTIPNLVAIEFADPGTNNTKLFAKHNIPWVSGTTGVKKEELAGCGVYDVNMAPSLVAIGSALECLGNGLDGILKGFKGWFSESHQLYKADPSGTRKKWDESFARMGAELEMILPERLEPEGHGYHKVNMHSSECTQNPLKLWAAMLEYIAHKFKDPLDGFFVKVKCRSNDDARLIWDVLGLHDQDLGVAHIGPEPTSLIGVDTKGAQIANTYLALGNNDAAINFYFNTHEKRGTNAGFETRVNGRGLYQPGIIAAVRHQHERFYVRGEKEGIDNMMGVLKK